MRSNDKKWELEEEGGGDEVDKGDEIADEKGSTSVAFCMHANHVESIIKFGILGLQRQPTKFTIWNTNMR